MHLIEIIMAIFHQDGLKFDQIGMVYALIPREQVVVVQMHCVISQQTHIHGKVQKQNGHLCVPELQVSVAFSCFFFYFLFFDDFFILFYFIFFLFAFRVSGHHQFEATLGARNGVPKRHYAFRAVKSNKNGGKFKDVMIAGCKALGAGWKPVCDHPTYCRTDSNSIYLGQAHHIAYPSHRNNNGYFPSGWAQIKSNWDGLCSYSGAASGGGTNALCNFPANTHSWQAPKTKWYYMCAKILSMSSNLRMLFLKAMIIVLIFDFDFDFDFLLFLLQELMISKRHLVERMESQKEITTLK